MGLFAISQKESQIGVDFLADGVAVAQVRTGNKNTGDIIRSAFIGATGQEAQVEALKDWVRSNSLHKTPCVCLVADDDCDIYQVEHPEVEDAEINQALSWKIKDLVNYDVSHAVVDNYPVPPSSKNNQRQVRVVAARDAVIGSYVDSVKSTALALKALDVHELAPSNLQLVQHSTETSLALLTLNSGNGLLSVYHDTDLYVTRDFPIGIDQLEMASAEDESVVDALLLELQRSLDYFESFYGIGTATSLRIFPQLEVTEKLAQHLQHLTSFEIEFIAFAGDDENPQLEPRCFYAYCAALRGVSL